MADLLTRRDFYTRTSQALTDLDDNQFGAAIGERPPDARRGWGDSYRAEICGFPVFVKGSLRPTRRGAPRQYEQRLRLPDFYHYGVGSAGFGAFRELAGHLKTLPRSEYYHDVSLRRTHASSCGATSGVGTPARPSAG